ncbi:hypothetical protein BHYA_0165g00280 [Botrytis hyacinthi]|uniref:DUF6570 domain-containing protein n=1 Tax=Botrytis hyacinthi TaxID=278943 RepID=A0A4Z1GE97_9HELO|nr:hypothetical protein BHYA_0165g00280 [Botrytis hyacinthi]
MADDMSVEAMGKETKKLVLKDLSFMERSLIARGNPVGSVLKLGRTKNKENEYMATRGLFVSCIQDHSNLLNILPSPEDMEDPVIRVAYTLKEAPTDISQSSWKYGHKCGRKVCVLPRAVMQNTVVGVGNSLRTTVDSSYGKNIELGICPQKEENDNTED